MMIFYQPPKMLPYLDDFLDDHTWKPDTRNWYKVRICHFIEYLKRQGVEKPLEITARHIVRFQAQQRKQDLSWSTRNGSYTALDQFFRWLKLNGEIDENVFDSELIKRPRKPRTMVRPLKYEYATAMIRAAEAKINENGDVYACRDVAMMRLLLNTGIRRQELVNIAIEDVNMQTGEITITGKFDNQRPAFASQPTIDAITSWLEVRPKTDDTALFISLHPHKAGVHTGMRPDSVNDILNVWKKPAGVPDNVSVSPHKWRHLFGTHFAERTNNPFALQELMGHSDIGTTKIYVQFNRKQLKGLADLNSPDVE